MTKRTLAIDGVEVPCFFYGTAWKEDRTQDLTELALQFGFRGIDTVNQRRHYDKAALGRAISDRRVLRVDTLWLRYAWGATIHAAKPWVVGSRYRKGT